MERAATILKAIGEVLAVEDPEVDICATLDTPSNRDAWIQITRDMINAAYPFEGEPQQMLSGHGLLQLEIVTWEANKYVTFRHVGVSPKALAGFVDTYLSEILGAAGPDVSVTMEDLG
jgi:hypothetical protein